MDKSVEGSEPKKEWYLVVVSGVSPLVVARMDLVPRVRDLMDVAVVHQKAMALFAENPQDALRLRTFLFHPKTGSCAPTITRFASATAEVKFLEHYPWINVADAPPKMTRFLSNLGVAPHALDPKYRDMAARRVPFSSVPLPAHDC